MWALPRATSTYSSRTSRTPSGGAKQGTVSPGSSSSRHWQLDTAARPALVESEEGFERWDGRGALGYLVLEEIIRATLSDPPERARVVVARRCFPTGVLGYWVRRLAGRGRLRRRAHGDFTAPVSRIRTVAQVLTGTNPVAIAIPSSDGSHVVADVSMGAVTHGDVLAGRASPDELVPFGGGHAHKAFALAVGLELFVSALAGPEHGAVLAVARPQHDPVPAFRGALGRTQAARRRLSL